MRLVRLLRLCGHHFTWEVDYTLDHMAIYLSLNLVPQFLLQYYLSGEVL